MSSPAPSLRPILIADDNEDDLFLTRQVLRRCGIENPAITVEDGHDAIVYLSGCIGTGHLPCLVLLDIKMPRQTGFDVLEWARAQPALANLRFVVLSSSDFAQDRARATRLGALDCLVKYDTADQLVVLVQQHCPEVVTHATDQ